MNIYTSIPLFSAIIYFVLIFFVLNSGINNTKRSFIFYLSAMVVWSVTAFLVHGDFFSNTRLVHEVVVAAGFLTPIAFFYFASAFTNRVSHLLIILSLVFLVALLILDFGGYIVLSATVENGVLISEMSTIYFILYICVFVFVGIGVYYFIKHYRNSNDPLERNRVAYLIFGMVVLIAFNVPNFIEATAKYPIDHIGNVIYALLITYAIMKYQLLNIKFIFRIGLTYVLLIVPLMALYIGILIASLYYFPNISPLAIGIFTTIMVLVLVVAFRTLNRRAQELVDRFFYRDTYKHRQLLLNIDNKLGGVINLSQLADEILPTLCRALRISRAQLLLRDNTGSFVAQFAYPEIEDNEVALALNTDNPMISWLEKKNRPFELRELENIPEFKSLWQSEIDDVSSSKLGLFCPVKNKGVLTGIFALGKKQNGIYSQEDLEMTMAVASQAGLIIENAQHYSQALLKANTDGLTGLYNHRHFHERLEQEIARSSRFGTVFSVIIADIDLFKVYNDNYGHLAGDEVLRHIGEYIKSSIRSIDIAARYGGEEFSVILPETRLIDAQVVAERIRKTIELKTNSREMPVTVSVGVASWPIDGVMKEELINRADRALYTAKQNGRNRVCLSTDIIDIGAASSIKEAEVNPKSLSMIYALAATVDAKDHYTYGHSRKVSEYAVALVEGAKLPKEKISIVRAAGLLHDIGKIGIPDSILNKKEPLSHEEWEPIKAHPQLGVAIIRHIVDLTDCLPAILHHHEHYDGSGYPAGLKGKNIPVEARVLSIADAYEAMTSPRAYRKQMTTEEAIAELKSHSGIQFDPELVQMFCKILEVTPSWHTT
ncbi:MAG: diguanylate cyclase [Dehalococcoidales bacterium]|nr:diguanylate cyclase [Dehalococcoidales bacterium]